MLGGLFGLDNKQQLYLAATQVVPTLITIVSLHVFKDALIALFFLQVFGYILIPKLYIQYMSKEHEVGIYFLNEFKDRTKQIKVGVSLGCSAFGLVFLSYFFLYEFKQNILLMLQIPVKDNFFYLLTFLILFAFINPILEEWFWRLFLQKTYSDSEKNKWLLNINYTLFHWFIFCYIMDWRIATGITTTFFSIGKSFDYIKGKYGFITNCITHFGLSLAGAFALLDILYLEWENQQMQ